MRILGVDPGTRVMGYGVIESRDGKISLVDCGALNVPPRAGIGECLNFLYREISEVIARNNPDAVAVEQPFIARNVKSALAIGKAQTVTILAAANHGLPTYEYTPAQIKQRIANNGASSKEQIQEMVRLQLDLAEAPHPHDAADALAVALCHRQEMHLKRLLTQ